MSSPEHRSNRLPVEYAVDLIEKDEFWRAMHEGFTGLRSDPVAWADYLREAALWDSAGNDGLEDDEPHFTDEGSPTSQSG